MRLKRLLNENIEIIQIFNTISTKEELIDYINKQRIELDQIVSSSNLTNLLQLSSWRLPVLINLSNPKITENFLKALVILAAKNNQIKRNLIPKIIKDVNKEKIPKYIKKYYERLYNKSMDQLSEDISIINANPQKNYTLENGKIKKNTNKNTHKYKGIPIHIFRNKAGELMLQMLVKSKDGNKLPEYNNLINYIKENYETIIVNLEEYIKGINSEKAEKEIKGFKEIKNNIFGVGDKKKSMKDILPIRDFDDDSKSLELIDKIINIIKLKNGWANQIEFYELFDTILKVKKKGEKGRNKLKIPVRTFLFNDIKSQHSGNEEEIEISEIEEKITDEMKKEEITDEETLKIDETELEEEINDIIDDLKELDNDFIKEELKKELKIKINKLQKINPKYVSPEIPE
jgi:hypothetical protein